jgi:hypothetical protein
MFETKNMSYYLFLFSVIFISSYLATQVKNTFDTNNDYEMIKKYLLNDSPLYGFNKPKIWIHTDYHINSRVWKAFYSRNSTDLNQPYIHLTVKTIINHCGNDFNICLIDDDTFSKLIPTWDIDMNSIAEPMKSQIREIGLLKLVYYYGGIVLPNSFICLKNLKQLYNEGLSNTGMFVCEKINNSVNLQKHQQRPLFVPGLTIYGGNKNSDTVKELIEYLKVKALDNYFSSESDFLGIASEWCSDMIKNGKITLIDGSLVGVKSARNKPILIEDLMGEDYLDLNKDIYGIYIPRDDLLRRPKYSWFCVLNSKELLETNLISAKYIKASLVDTTNEYYTSTEKKSVVAI